MARSRLECVRRGQLSVYDKSFLIEKIIRLERGLNWIEEGTRSLQRDEDYYEEIISSKEVSK